MPPESPEPYPFAHILQTAPRRLRLLNWISTALLAFAVGGLLFEFLR